MGRTSGFEDETAEQPDALEFSGTTVRRFPTLQWTDARGTHTRTIDSRLVIGSSDTVDVVVADPAVSRLHAEVETAADGAWVKDLSSRNGTYVSGVRVSGARLPAGPSLRIGSITLRVSYDDTPSTVELWPSDRFGPMLGQSIVMREFFARLARVAATESTVLVSGETGTGKELVARAIHEASKRKDEPFVVVDCGALTEALLEGELFGHRKGAFTGAISTRSGAIEDADGGTVFLDEIGDLPLSLQPKLLRVLESRTVRRLGETDHRRVNVRFVSATHRDLGSMVNEGAFREDLYFRLAVLPVVVPPLRARREDIKLLATSFLQPGAMKALPPDLFQELMSRPWLGNVRELRNFVERAQALGTSEALAMATGPGDSARLKAIGALPAPPVDRPFKDVRDAWLDHLEREYMRGMIARHGRRITAMATEAQLDPSYVHRLLKKHDL